MTEEAAFVFYLLHRNQRLGSFGLVPPTDAFEALGSIATLLLRQDLSTKKALLNRVIVIDASGLDSKLASSTIHLVS